MAWKCQQARDPFHSRHSPSCRHRASVTLGICCPGGPPETARSAASGCSAARSLCSAVEAWHQHQLLAVVASRLLLALDSMPSGLTGHGAHISLPAEVTLASMVKHRRTHATRHDTRRWGHCTASCLSAAGLQGCIQSSLCRAATAALASWSRVVRSRASDCRAGRRGASATTPRAHPRSRCVSRDRLASRSTSAAS